MSICVFQITKPQSLNKISLSIFKKSAIAKTSIEMSSISIISFLSYVISPVKIEVAMATRMTVDFIVGKKFLEGKISNVRKI